MSDNIKNKDEIQEKFKPKREKAVKSSESMMRLEMYNRGERMNNCATWLKFATCEKDGYKKLVGASFCRDRLCPMCNWRRSLLYTGQMIEMLHVAMERKKMRFIFSTFTVLNVKGSELKETLDMMFKGFKEMFDYKEIDKNIIGWVRNLEITYNEKDKTYHPHFHVLIGVAPRYFQKDYISQKKWTSFWQKACKLDYVPIVNVKAVKAKKEGQTIENAAAETAKYSVKDTDYIKESESETDEIIEVLATVLKGRRLIGFGKLFRQIRKELKQADLNKDDADLIGKTETDCTCPLCSSTLIELLYKWDFNISNYRKGD